VLAISPASIHSPIGSVLSSDLEILSSMI
jgi:hypothetical protein